MTRTEVTGWLAALGVAAIGGAVLLGGGEKPKPQFLPDRIVIAPCFEKRIATREAELKTATGVTRIAVAAAIDSLRLGRKLVPAGQHAEREIAGRCYYRLPGDLSKDLEEQDLAQQVVDPAVLRELCCTCPTPGPCRMVGQCEGVKC